MVTLRSRLRALAPFSILAAAGLAQAQCTWFIEDVPDFDQRRSAGGGHAGLPANGGMYCVPTSFTNWFAYLANRGIPQANGLDGPRDWQSDSNYDHVTDILTFMGTVMNTDPQEGTKGGSIPGAKAYAFIACNGDLVITAQRVWGGAAPPSPSNLLTLHNLGAYTAGTYGFYTSSTGGTRTGGHAISFTGVWDLGCGSAPILQFSDPADDSANTSQSAFRTSLAAMTAVTGNFRPKAGEPSQSKTLYRLDITTASVNFLDAIFCILPTAALFGGGGSDAGELQLVRPFVPTGNPAPGTVAYNKAAGTGAVMDAAVAPNPLIQYYTTAQGTSQAPGVWRLDLVTGQSTRINPGGTTSFNPTRLAIGRFGDLYVISNGAVSHYDTSTTPMTFLGATAPTPDADAIAYDDKNDTVVILTVPSGLGARQLLTVPRSLSGFGTNRSVPNTYNGAGYVQPDADTANAFFICSDGSGILRRYMGSGGSLVETDSIIHLNGSLSALNVTDANRLVYANNGVLVEKEKNAAGNWVNRAGSRWAGRAAPGSVCLARSRDDFDASIMSGPEFNNVLNPTVYPSLPACYANCDNSTTAPVLNVLDFACFLNKFASGNVYANCDHSTAAPALNVLDFACFLNKFAAGCP